MEDFLKEILEIFLEEMLKPEVIPTETYEGTFRRWCKESLDK